MSDKTDKQEMVKCHHRGCGHEWLPRVKKPVKCPQCHAPLWKSAYPKKRKAASPPAPDVDYAAVETSIELSEETPAEPPIIDTSMPESDVSGVVVETPIQRARREAEERLRRLADEPIE